MAAKKVTKVDESIDPKKKALETALKQLEHDFGEGTIMKLGENKHMNVQSVSTGSVALDRALGIGGVPKSEAKRS